MVIKLKKGFDVNLKGQALVGETPLKIVDSYAVKPTDFHGITRPKLLVKEGDKVKAGTGIFFDKKTEKIIHTAPVSGEITDIIRGEKRKLLEIRIKADQKIAYEEFNAFGTKYDEVNKAIAIEILCQSGLWTRIIQRPYGTIADVNDTPKSIFISGFDSHPLAPDYTENLKEHSAEFAAGIEILKKLCPTIHLTERKNQTNAEAYKKATGIEKHTIEGVHPAGNVGVQIHHISPINKGEIVWTVTAQSVVFIGRLFMIGYYDTTRIVSFVGAQLKNPQCVKLHIGACVNSFVKGDLTDENVRIISGNVLTGISIGKQGYINSNHDMITVIKEGNYQTVFGWILPSSKISFHRAFGLFSWLKGKNATYDVDTNVNGQTRAFVQSGTFEKVTPMDILPTHLLKAILSEDFDGMESLGIYEVIEEDLALCEFIDVSKHDVQGILREGLELLQNS